MSTERHSQRRKRRAVHHSAGSKTSAAETCLTTPFTTLKLQRRPRRHNEVLQAWDNADRYLLERVAQWQLSRDSRILIVNDMFGALTCALSEFDCVSWTDSAVCQLASQQNSAENHCRAPRFVAMTETPCGPFDAVLFRLPRSHSLLQYQLQRLRGLGVQPQRMLGTVMAKYLEPSTLALCSAQLGEASASLAWKKARLIEFSNLLSATEPEDDRAFTELPEWGMTLSNRANVFCRGKLDRGSRLLLSVLAQLQPAEHIADLGCGNGLLGIAAARQWPGASVHFFDDSHLAVDSARENCQTLDIDQALFSVDDCMSQYDGQKFDLVLCNPPFHQEQQLGDHIARQMFRHARQHLQVGGQLCVVGNRHLGYHHKLKGIFPTLEVIASDAKFVVWLAGG